ncbi:hypothetical protein NIES970_04310 [[Synechococcus] sp. NIES-970]|nr:hypothetical protein NIES970_04310 [[Synechococcus] sp. NIES-970]
MAIYKKVYKIQSVSPSELVLKQGIDKITAIILAFIPSLAIVLWPLSNFLGYRYAVYLAGLFIYTFLFFPFYLMPYARYLKVDADANQVIYFEAYLVHFLKPGYPWFQFLPQPKVYILAIPKFKTLQVTQYDTIRFLGSGEKQIFPDFKFTNIYELTRTVVRMSPLLNASILVNPWEGNYSNPYAYLRRKLKEANIMFATGNGDSDFLNDD